LFSDSRVVKQDAPHRMSLAVFQRMTRLLRGGSISSVARRVKERRLTYLSSEKIRNLERCLREIEARGVPGLVIEAGVALGGSAILLASQMGRGRSFRGYDVFGRIPPPSERDDEKSRARFAVIEAGQAKGLGDDPYYGYVDNLYEQVVKRFESFGLAVDGQRISLHRGLFAETMVFEPGARVALAHIDCDWHDPVSLCLERLYPVWSPGGYWVIDDYNDYGGCRRAVDEFLAGHDDVIRCPVNGNLVLQCGR
jgi:asparagine synthase (glutamine-hydrolysing)